LCVQDSGVLTRFAATVTRELRGVFVRFRAPFTHAPVCVRDGYSL
jgi:hypothetical protein